MQASLLIQLRTGHILLQKYLYRIGKVNCPRCLACHMRDETDHHYLTSCLAYRGPRSQMEKVLHRGAQSIRMLLTNQRPSNSCSNISMQHAASAAWQYTINE